MNFTPKQQHSLLSKMGYTGPVDSQMMERFIQSNPGAAAKMGKFSRFVQKGFAEGGVVSSSDPIAQAYQEVLGREPDPAGYAFYNKLLNSGTSIEQIKGYLEESPEYNVRTAYQDILGRDPLQEEEGFQNWIERYQENFETYKQNPDTFLEEFQKGTAPELQKQTEQTQTTTPVDYTQQIQGAYQNVFGRAAKQPGLDFYSKVLQENPNFNLTESLKESPEAIVRGAYQEYLGRAPREEEQGFKNWIERYQESPDIFLEEFQKGTAPELQKQVEQKYSEVGSDPEKLSQSQTADLNAAKANLQAKTEALAVAERTGNQQAIEAAQKEFTEAQQQLQLVQTGMRSTAPSAFEVTQQALKDPSSIVKQAETVQMAPTPEQIVSEGTGTVGATPLAQFTSTGSVNTAQAPTAAPAATMTPSKVASKVNQVVGGLRPAQGSVSKTISAQTFDPNSLAQLGLSAPQIAQAQQIANVPDLALTQDQLAQAATLASTGLSLPQAVAQTTGEDFTAVAAKFTGETPQAIAQDQYNLTPTQIAQIQKTQVEEAAKASEIPSAQAAQSSFQSDIQAVQGQVGANELVKAKDILGLEQAVTAIAATSESLNEASIANAAQGTLSQASLAQAAQGEVTPESTVQGQMSKLMKQFDDGTPAWAAGAMRAANAAMAARGVGGSSMAGAAIVQASMEAALPIAQQDAQAFQQMNLANLSNRQQVAIANAAAFQNMELANLNNRQQAALQNSANAFALQSQNLSNTQQVIIANAQFKAAFQEQTLNIKTQTALANAAKYAEVNRINLTNEQQTRLQNSAQNLQVNLQNLSNKQQTDLANLQVRASLVGQELSNEQQMAVLRSTQAFEAAAIDANNQQQAFMQDASAQAALEGRAMDARQQTALFNVSNQLREREIELTNEQQTRLFNTTNAMNIEMANLSNKQQTALANAQIEAAIRGQELSNTQQVNVVNAARISEIANLNFTAEQQKALENARLAQSVDIENLNAAQAKLMADVAAMSQMELANLNNRQQAAVQNAQNFLQMDLTNLNNEQQTAIFSAQQRVNALLSDQAAENAAKQFNAASENQTNQFFADLASTTARFNADQTNAINQFNSGQANAVSQFNASLKAQRDQFNANNRLIVAQANAKWRQDIATLNTAAQNEAIMQAAKTANALTATAMDEIWQRERDLMSYSWQTSENARDRHTNLLIADKQIEAEKVLQASSQAFADNQGKGAVLGQVAAAVGPPLVEGLFGLF